MINWNKINKKISVKKIVLPLFVVILILLGFIYFSIMQKYIRKNIFASEMEQVFKENENPEFSIEKIYLCSSANAVDSTKEQKLNNLSLYQYTDIAVYLNNNSEDGLTNKNTIKELYIDDINIELESQIGNASLVYTNLLKIGNREEIKNMLIKNEEQQKDRIDFKILNTNEQNNDANYEYPTFYADCSNPISLKYINKINKEYTIGKDEIAAFDGSILKKAGINIEDINARISFKINLVNNNDKNYSALVSFKLPLNDIYEGTSIKSKTTVGREYDFLTL